jgi:hypothetical protein
MCGVKIRKATCEGWEGVASPSVDGCRVMLQRNMRSEKGERGKAERKGRREEGRLGSIQRKHTGLPSTSWHPSKDEDFIHKARIVNIHKSESFI